MQTIIAGIPVLLERKRVKNINLRVTAPDGQVKLSAPSRVPDAVLESFVERHVDWLRAKIKEMQRQRPTEAGALRYVTGERISLWGEQNVLLVEEGRHNSCTFEGGQVRLTVRSGSTRAKRESIVREAMRQELMHAICQVAPEIERMTGLFAKEWRTKQMKTRWGTCNVMQRRIWINLELVRRPPICLRYIILHEVLHLTEPYHNAHFYAMMTYYMPRWRMVREHLKQRI